MSLNRAKLQLHTDLIAAFRELSTPTEKATVTAADDGETELERGSVVAPKSRESILEQAVAEQNRIIEIMQDFADSLEADNKACHDRLTSQSRLLAEAEQRAREAEKHLQRFSSSAVASQSSKMADTESNERDHSPATLPQSELQSLPSTMKKSKSFGGSENFELSPSAFVLASTRAKLEAERIRVIELEENLLKWREEIERLKDDLSEKRSMLISKESEVLHCRHEMESLRKGNNQHKNIIMSLRRSLTDKDMQLNSLMRALNEVRNHSLQKPQKNDVPLPSKMSMPLFDQIMGRNICALTLHRSKIDAEMGFSYCEMDAPVSSKSSCIIVRAVKEQGPASGLILPGDEILEVNGYSCRSSLQSKALECLQQATGTIQIVVAREPDLSYNEQNLFGPNVKKSSDSMLWSTPPAELPLVGDSSHLISTISSFQQLQSTKGSTEGADPSNISRASVAQENDELKSLSDELSLLKLQLSDTEKKRGELEEEIGAAQEVLSDATMECDLTRAENYELQEQASSNDKLILEMIASVNDIQDQLRVLGRTIAHEELRAHSLESKNSELFRQLHLSKTGYEYMTKQSKESQSKFTLADNELKEARNQVSAMKVEKQTLVSKHEAEMEAIKKEMESTRKTYEENISSDAKEIEKLKAQVSLLERSALDTSSTSKTLEEENEHVKKELHAAKTLLLQAELAESGFKMDAMRLKQAADLANKQLAEVEESLKHSNLQLSRYKEIVETKTLEMESLSTGLHAARNKITNNKETVTRMQKEIDNQRRNNAVLHSENRSLEQVLEEQNHTCECMEAERGKLKEKLLEISKQNQVLRTSLSSAKESISFLKQQENQLEDKVTELKRSLEASSQREYQHDEEIQELEAAREDMELEFTREVEALKAERAGLRKEIESLKAEGRMFSDQELPGLQQQLASQRESLMQAEGESARLSCELKMVQKNSEKHFQEMKCLKSEHETLTNENASFKEKHEQLQRGVEAQKVELAEAQNLTVSLKEECKRLEEAMEKFSEERRIEVRELTSNNWQHEKKATETQLKLDSAESELEETRKALHELKDKFDEHEENLHIEQKQREKLKQNCVELQNELESVVAAKQRCEGVISSMEFVHKQDQEELQQVKEMLEKKEFSLQKTREELVALENELRKLTSKLQGENSSLSENVSQLSQQVEDLASSKETEISKLIDSLKKTEEDLECVREELKKTTEAKTTCETKLIKLKSELAHALKERYSTMKELETVTKKKKELEHQLEDIQDKHSHAEEEVTVLRKERKHSEVKVDDLSARVQVLAMNLEVAGRNLEDKTKMHSEASAASEELQLKLSESLSSLESAQTELNKTNMELHSQQETVSQLKTRNGLLQRECEQMQQALLSVEKQFADSEEKTTESNRELEQKVLQLTETLSSLETSAANVESENKMQAETLVKEKEALQSRLEEAQRSELHYKDELEKAKSVNLESQQAINQLKVMYETLKNSLEEQKDIEILKLSSQMKELNSTVSETQLQLSTSRDREATLESVAAQREEEVSCCKAEGKALQEEVEKLKLELEVQQNFHKELSDVHEKVSRLEENLMLKTACVSELENEKRKSELEHKSVKAENESLISKVAELADLKVTLAEQLAELQKVQGKFAAEVKAKQSVAAERDNLLATLRKLEVEKHTQALVVSPILSEDADKEEIVSRLKSKEEEAHRLREYVGMLLSNVVERAPFLLEKFH